MQRTAEKDQREKELILIAEKLLCEGVDTGNQPGFEFDGIWIINPTTSENGMETVNPEEYYGQKYVDWYNSL